MKSLEFKQNIVLENEVALLRPLSINDLPELNHFAINEPTLWEFSLTGANGIENMKKYVENAVADRSNQTSYPFLVIDKRTNTIAGSTRFYDYNGNYKTVQLGYTWYGKNHQRTGLNRNCKLLLLQYAFEELQLERVEFRADYNNERSITAMKNIGCTVEGVLRSNCSSPNGRRDSIVLSILKSEWNDIIKNELLQKIN